MSKKRRSKPRKKVEKRIKEFRKERTKEGVGHPRFFYKKRGRRFFGIGITHGERKNGKNTILLKKEPNPHPKDKRPARVVPKIEEVAERDLGNRLQGWAFCEEDEKMVFDLIAALEAEQKNNKQ